MKIFSWMDEDQFIIEIAGDSLEGRCLRELDFRFADLEGLSLRDADLSGSDLSYAFLRGADLTGAHAGGTTFYGAEFYNAILDVEIPPLNDAWFISQVLINASENFEQRSWAASIRTFTDMCWGDFLDSEEIPQAAKDWARDILVGKWPIFDRKFKYRRNHENNLY